VIWAACKDPGGLNVVLPVVKALRVKYPVNIVTNGPMVAENLLSQNEPFIYAGSLGEAVEFMDLLSTELFFTSMCSSGIGIELSGYLKGLFPTVMLQDFWGAWLSDFGEDHQAEYICVNDKTDAGFVEKAWPNFPKNNIKITGYPSFDKYASIDCVSIRQKVYSELKLDPTRPMVLFAGQLWYTADALHEVVYALNQIRRDVYFVPRFHPRMMRTPEWEREKTNCLDALSRYRGSLIEDTYMFDGPTILAAADVVTGMFTTMLLEAAALGKPNVSVLYPDSGMKQFRAECPNLSEFPLVEMGCTYKATKGDELVQALSRVLENSNELRANQEKNFKLDGQNTKRVADFIESLL